MNSDRLRHIIVALGVLIFLWGVVEIFQSGFEGGEDDLALPVLTEAQVDSVMFVSRGSTTRLTKNVDGVWAVNGSTAARTAIDEVFTMLAEPNPGSLVSQNPSTHERMEIADDIARRMTVYGGGESGEVLLDLLVGKRGRSFQDIFVRIPNENEVYKVRSQAATYIERDLSDWRDRQIANMSSELIASVEVRSGRQSYRVSKNDGGWSFANGQPADSAAVSRWLREFATLTALGFPTEAQRDSANFDSAERRAVLKDVAGQTLLDIAFDSIGSGFLVSVAGDTTMWRLDAGKVARMAPADSVLRSRAD